MHFSQIDLIWCVLLKTLRERRHRFSHEIPAMAQTLTFGGVSRQAVCYGTRRVQCEPAPTTARNMVVLVLTPHCPVQTHEAVATLRVSKTETSVHFFFCNIYSKICCHISKRDTMMHNETNNRWSTSVKSQHDGASACLTPHASRAASLRESTDVATSPTTQRLLTWPGMHRRTHTVLKCFAQRCRLNPITYVHQTRCQGNACCSSNFT